jgi:hypothetical protein
MENKIKKIFEKKLKELGVYDEFISNLENNLKLNYQGKNEAEIKIKELNSRHCFSLFVLSSFIWKNTPEGNDFWENISEQ